MKRPGLLIALALVVIVNIVVLTGVSANRRGEPDTIWLTERELPLAYSYYGAGTENSGVSLNLTWNRYETDWSWLNAAKMTELGFTIPRRANDDEDHRSYRRPLPRKAYVVLEYDGERWQAFRREKLEKRAELETQVAQEKLLPEAAERQREQIDYQLATASHLFAIDAGLNPSELRQRYPDQTRYLISLARVRLNYWYPRGNEKEADDQVRGTIAQLLPNSIHVPLPEQKDLKAIVGDTWPRRRLYSKEEGPARKLYRVKLHYGARHEPWIAAVTESPE
mgnify:FL=1